MIFHTEWPRLDEGGLGAIEAWVQAAKAPKLVIIDVWAKVRGRADGKKTLYTDDFEQLTLLQRLASAHRLGIAALPPDRVFVLAHRTGSDRATRSTAMSPIEGKALGVGAAQKNRVMAGPDLVKPGHVGLF